MLPASLSRLIGLILLLVGAPFACVGVYEGAQAVGVLGSARRTEGTVVDNAYQTVQDGTLVSGAYHPVIEFTTDAGERVRFTDGVGSLPPDYDVGAPVPVLYDPANPHGARLWSWKRVWFVPTLFVGLGLLPAGVFGLWQGLTALKHHDAPAQGGI